MEIRKNAGKAKKDAQGAEKPQDASLYEVIMQDEYDNLYLLGLYASLEEALPDINGWLEPYTEDGAVPFEPGDLEEYASTFGSCFDREVEWKDEDACPGCIMVRGFNLSARAVADDAARILSGKRKED